MLKAITLWQPHASLVALEKKRNETRSRLTHHRGDLAICSAKNSPIGTLDKMMREPFRSALGIDDLPIVAPNVVDLAAHFLKGFVLAVVEVTGYQRITTALASRLEIEDPEEFAFGDYTAGRYIWTLRNVRRLREPVPVKGGQFIFHLPPEVEAKVRAQI